ncbi:hypothetical protein N7481_003866 [Penicillium waksmanii]|uniref:uncharacterized protein n=1 Tax=Penicillium waksmanii TaxID=69791 RepID=UPI002548BA38|nr:uncharacterized protein N7481_003866 [Penicillium waksmanii]KAJ5988656.1 hypothetical protein N7481_003866 [Penicillium waksmanii]
MADKDTDVNSRLDEQIQQMRQNIVEVRKRRELAELQAEFESENRLFEEAQRRLEAMRAPAPESHGAPAHANSNINSNANVVTQTPSKQLTTTNGASALLSPQMSTGGFTIKGTAHTKAVDQFMDSLHGEMGRAEPILPPVHDEGAANGGLRSTSQSAPTPIQAPQTPGHRPQSQHSRRPSEPANPLSPITEQEPCLTVIPPRTRSQVSEAESGSEHSTVISEEHESDQSDGSHSRNSDPDESMDMDQSSSPQIPSNTPRGPSRSMTTAPLSRGAQRLQHPAPDPSMPKYQADSWQSCLKLMQALETHFSIHPEFYSFEDRKVQLGEKYLNAALASEWDDRRRKLRGPSWVAFCLFLAEQLAEFVKPDVARRKYTGTYQRQGEGILNFAMYLQQYAPHFNSAHHNRVRHFHDRVLPKFRNRAGRKWHNFDGLHEIVECMVKVEQSLPNYDGLGPRKRVRANS